MSYNVNALIDILVDYETPTTYDKISKNLAAIQILNLYKQKEFLQLFFETDYIREDALNYCIQNDTDYEDALQYFCVLKHIKDEFLGLPVGLTQRGYKMFELLEARGNTLGEPYTKSLKDGLFEIRIKSDEGIARSIYCYEMGKKIIILLTFVKKTQKRLKVY